MSHVLVIEDQNLISMSILEDLIEQGFTTVDVATTEAEAVALASTHCPDLIIADDELASGSGIAAVQEICRDKLLSVVFIPANADRILAAIPDAVVVLKPFAMHELRVAIMIAVKTPVRIDGASGLFDGAPA